MRADLKGEVLLGFVLLATALLVGTDVGRGLSAVYRDVLGLTSFRAFLGIGPLLGMMGLAATLAGVVAAIVVDRRGPRWVMPLGALLAGVGFMLMALTTSLWWLILTSLVAGLALAGVSGVVLYAVSVKSCYQIRGTVIGILVFVTTLRPTVASPLLDTLSPRASALVVGGLALVGALFLFRMLPRVFPVLQHPDTLPAWRPTPEDDRDLTGRGLMQLPGFWKVTAVLALVFALKGALFNSSALHLAVEGHNRHFWSVAVGSGALLWGVASDYFRARLLLTVASLVAVVTMGLGWLLSEQPGIVGDVAVGLAMGATYSLPWVLLADHIGVRFFATVGAVLLVVGSLLGGLSVPLVLNSVSYQTEFWVMMMIAIAIALAIATVRAPRLEFHSKPN